MAKSKSYQRPRPSKRPKPMTPKAGFTQTPRRYGNGGKRGK